jgi:uncharacterized membrane-anchored protein
MNKYLSIIYLHIIVALLVLGVANYPIVFGKKIILHTTSIDPIDPMRGRYVHLNYSINNIDEKFLDKPVIKFNTGATIFITLDTDGNILAASDKKEDLLQKAITTLNQNSDPIIIKGTIKALHTSNLLVEYGIEAYFTKPELAKTLETKKLAAQISVSQDGQARLLDVWPIN